MFILLLINESFFNFSKREKTSLEYYEWEQTIKKWKEIDKCVV